ncbi:MULTISPECIES: AMP nucleosidase [Holospora]|uniref:AMP nucleosidase n=2 Tax=Holospora TaxID=44747 RepID=A0A061JIN6_9PROT|nr:MULTISPECIES: AMP nucleosidase [Holospora]ETZ04959.1 AMP nucleosidase [Holospora undulata HU1]GAJ46486.1 AMP nucleosidase [Holospora elegans E1]
MESEISFNKFSCVTKCAQEQLHVEVFVKNAGLHDPVVCRSAQETIQTLEALYLASVQDLRNAVGSPSGLKELKLQFKGTYPYLGIWGKGAEHVCEVFRSWAILREDGYYGTTVTHPDLFKEYWEQQLLHLFSIRELCCVVGRSSRFIPIYFLKEDVLSHAKDISQIKGMLTMPSPKDMDDQVANGTVLWDHLAIKPLSYFPAERTDYSVTRIHHYCGTSASSFQNFILLTNYQRYVDLFFHYAKQRLSESDGVYTHWIEPKDTILSSKDMDLSRTREAGHHFQMPAYHLVSPDRNGISLVNIGVGPSNAKNMTDHLAVLRPHCWIMLGHCAGLRQSQRLGDYVLAHGYMRDDHVLDEGLSPNIPLPPVETIQKALLNSIQEICQLDDETMMSRVRCGTIVSTGDRNWELDVLNRSKTFRQCRAIALDMESGIIAANGFRFRVPYGTLLCVSDRPLHGELKLQSMAQTFYEQRVKEHLTIGIHALEALRRLGPDRLHTPELRGFQDVLFR